MRTIVFIDGQHLFHRAKSVWGGQNRRGGWRYRYPSYDVGRLAEALTQRRPRRSLVETRFYTGVPPADSYGTAKSWREFWLRKLNRMGSRGVKVYQGFARPKRQEKGVDVSIAIDLVAATYENRYDVAIIVSQDSDFQPAATLATKISRSQDRNVTIESAFPVGMNPNRQRGIPGTVWRPFNEAFYSQFLEIPKLYTYVVLHDTGFAPNPHHGYLTLACCKPQIRKTAKVGDWIVGIGSASKGRTGRAVYAMQVIETLSFEDYWNDPRFACKKPRMDAGPVAAVGDNAYHIDRETGEWIQEPCQHCKSDCSPSQSDMDADLSVNRVLIGETFTYWGSDGPPLPLFAGEQLFAGRGHKYKYPPEVVAEFHKWYDSLGLQGIVGDPADISQVQYPGT